MKDFSSKQAPHDFRIFRTPQAFFPEQCYLIFLHMERGEDNWKTVLDLYPPERLPKSLAAEGFALTFTEQFLPEHLNMLSQLREVSFCVQHASVCLPESVAGILCSTFQKIEDEFYSVNPDRFDLIRMYVHRVLTHIRKLQGHESLGNRLVNKFLQLLADSTFEPDEEEVNCRFVNYYATKLFVHPNHLSSMVKRETGKTANDLIASKLMQLAKYKLLKTDLSIKEIAFQLSFREPPHFSNFFKKYMRMSPAQYRKYSLVEVEA